MGDNQSRVQTLQQRRTSAGISIEYITITLTNNTEIVLVKKFMLMNNINKELHLNKL